MTARLDSAVVVPDVPAELGWAAALDRVLTGRDPLLVVAQPIVDLVAARTVGYEVLSRFPSGRVGPQDWFEAASRQGRESALNAMAVRSALRLRDDLPPDTFLSLNVDPHSLLDPQVMAAFTDLPHLDKVVVELTEHVPVDGSSRVLDSVGVLRSRGAMLAVDDAGSGYANLRSLLVLHPDLVKIDRDLVTGCGHDPLRRAVVQSLGELAGRLDAWAVAEGIETEADLGVLATMGIALGQGWLLGRPSTGWTELPERVAELLSDRTARTARPMSVEAVLLPLVTVERASPAGPGVVCDDDGRPQSVVLMSPDGSLVRVPAMTTAPGASVMDVVQRALSRPEPYRFAPVVCTDGRGRATAMATMDHLVEHLHRRLRVLTPTPVQSPPVASLPGPSLPTQQTHTERRHD